MLETLNAAIGEESVRGGSGAIYIMVKLPETSPDDHLLVEWLVKSHKVCRRLSD